MSTRSAGPMRASLHVQQQVEGDDGYGNVTVGWATIATVAAGLVPIRGTETVMASRMAGRQPYVVTIRSSEKTRNITPARRFVDARNDMRVFDIKSIADPDGKGAWLEALCEEVVS